MENLQQIDIHKLTVKDHSWVVELLEKASLPTTDVDLQKQSFIKITSAEKLVAVGALEVKGRYALLRSVVVPQSHQGKGAGIFITNALIDEARNKKISSLFLLTETADKFFSKFDFKVIDRADVPQEILSMEEFANICPSSAICMTLEI